MYVLILSHVFTLRVVIGASWDWEPYCPARLSWHNWSCMCV